jgi:hypothetical protein
MAMDMERLRERAETEQYSPEEVRYLRDVVLREDLLQANADKFGVKDPEAPDYTNDPAARAERVQKLNDEIVERQKELSQLQELEAQPDSAVADSGVAVQQASATAEDGAEDYSGAQWNMEALKAEIRNRNEARQQDGLEALPVTGNKPDLIARLIQDDREIAAAQQEDWEPEANK